MYFADEVRDPGLELDQLPSTGTFTPREISTAKQLIESMTSPWSPDHYRDTYRERVGDLIQRKKEGHEILDEAAPPAAQPVLDLVEALRRSVQNARNRRPGTAVATPGTGADAGDLRTLTKKELLHRARALDIRGRSRMAKHELLLQAVRSAQSARDRRAS